MRKIDISISYQRCVYHCIFALFALAFLQPRVHAVEARVQSYLIQSPQDEIQIKALTQRLKAEKFEFRQIYDQPTGQWLVVAPEAAHQIIAQQLPVAGQSQEAVTAQRHEVPNTREMYSLELKSLSASNLHGRLQQILGQQLPIQRDRTQEWLSFTIPQIENGSIVILANTKTREVRITGATKQADSWRKIIEILDTPSNQNQATHFFTPKQNSNEQVAKAVKALTKARLVSQSDEDANTSTQNPAKLPDKSLLGPVQIETVDGTETLILRGNSRDVDKVLQVIKQIERLAAISEPLVEVLELQHVESVAMSTLLKQVFSEALNSTRGYGTLTAIPLVKPNAVLIIGSPTTAEKAIEILKRLDQPSKSLTQFETFNLQHAKATDAQQIVENLFEVEESDEQTATLEPKAQAIADPRTNTLIVRAGPRDMLEVRELINEIDRAGSESINDLRIFKLKNSVADDLETVLQNAIQGDESDSENENLSRLLRLVTIDAEGQRQLKSGVLAEATITSSDSANALIISAPTESMPLFEALIKQLDQTPDAEIELKIFPVDNGDAVALSEMLIELFGDEDSSGGPGEGGITSLRIEVDERTNSVIAAGSREDLLVVEAILLKLDSSDARQRQNRVYHLKNKFAEDVALALNDWLRAERDIQGTAPGTTSPFQQIEREVVVVPENSSNSLIVSATPRYYKEIERLITDLDKQEAMVMVQVLIGEVTLGDADEFGLELGLQDSVLFDRSLLSDLETTVNTTITNDVGGGSTQFEQEIIQGANLTPGFDFGNAATPLGNSGSDRSLASAGSVGAQALSSFALSRVNPDLGFGGLVLSASSDSVSMLLRALQQSQRLEILSRPQIMALNNRDGRAFVGQEVPFITSSNIDQFGQRINNIEFRNVGLELIVTPRISPDNLVVMEVTAAKRELGPVSEGVPISIAPNGDSINAPIINTTEAFTTVSATSGQTIVLSGLLTKRDRALHRRVPLLADIPLLGDLFRFDSTSTVRSELLIILTPHVVRSRFEAEMLKQVESARMNWCLSDVVELHGPVGMRSQADRMGEAESEVIYPNEMPPTMPSPSQHEYYPTPIQEEIPALPQTNNAPTESVDSSLAKPDGPRLPWPFAKKDNESSSTSTIQ